MNDRPDPSPGRPPNLEQISTCWPLITDPVQFTLRYALAIERYLRALIRNPHDAEEVLQDFLLRGVEQGFARVGQVRGRFRDYLKTAVRNAAIDHLRRRRLPQQGEFDLAQIAGRSDEADRAWLAEWRECVLARVWEGLHRHQSRTPGNLYHTVLRLAAEHPADRSPALAARATALAGRPMTADGFRQQLGRARRAFAELLVEEIRKTLNAPTPERIEEELADLGLLDQVRELLPERARENS